MAKNTNKQQIKDFVARWQKAEGNEDREARSFLIEFLQDVLGIDNPTRVLDFERRVKGRKVDTFYEDMGILIEAKSREPGILDKSRDNGKKYGFETPYQQAKWYRDNMVNAIAPRWIIVTDFDEFRIHDLNEEYPERDYMTFKLEDLPEQKQIVEEKAQAVLDAREAHPGWSLVQLYDPDKMPADLLAAHKALDKAVEKAYGVDFNGEEEKIVAHLFKLYAEATKDEG